MRPVTRTGASRLSTGTGTTAVRIGGSGPPLVLVHGLQIGQELFDRLRPHLEPDFTVITYDQRDRGGTVFPASAYTVTELADDLAAVITASGYPRANVLGTSFGGMVAQSEALRHPELLDRLALAATSQAPFRPERRVGPTAALLAAMEAGDQRSARALLARMAPALTRGTEDDGPSDTAAPADALMRRFAATRGFDTRGSLGAVRSATLILLGRHDAVVPVEDVLAMVQEIPDAELVMLADTGHAWENEQPTRGAEALRSFLLGTR